MVVRWGTVHGHARRRCRAGEGGRVPDVRPAALVVVRETGLMWANMLRAFQVGKALTSDEGPSSRMRSPRVAGPR